MKQPFERTFPICRLYLFTRSLLINLPKTLPFPALLKTTEPVSLSTTLSGVDALLLPWEPEDGAEDARDQIDKHDPSPTFHGLCVILLALCAKSRKKKEKKKANLKKHFVGYLHEYSTMTELE